PGSTRSPGTTVTPAPGRGATRIAGAAAFDPPPGNGDEHNDEAARAVDGNPATFWETETYKGPHFADIKPGVGLVLTLAGRTTVHQLRVTTPTTGWAVQVFVADTPRSRLADWGAPVAERSGIDGDATFDLGGRAGGAVLLW